jgi:hypothetical protein
MVSLKKQLRRAPGITTIVVHGSTALFPFYKYSEAAARLKDAEGGSAKNRTDFPGLPIYTHSIPLACLQAKPANITCHVPTQVGCPSKALP